MRILGTSWNGIERNMRADHLSITTVNPSKKNVHGHVQWPIKLEHALPSGRRTKVSHSLRSSCIIDERFETEEFIWNVISLRRGASIGNICLSILETRYCAHVQRWHNGISYVGHIINWLGDGIGNTDGKSINENIPTDDSSPRAFNEIDIVFPFSSFFFSLCQNQGYSREN